MLWEKIIYIWRKENVFIVEKSLKGLMDIKQQKLKGEKKWVGKTLRKRKETS